MDKVKDYVKGNPSRRERPSTRSRTSSTSDRGKYRTDRQGGDALREQLGLPPEQSSPVPGKPAPGLTPVPEPGPAPVPEPGPTPHARAGADARARPEPQPAPGPTPTPEPGPRRPRTPRLAPNPEPMPNDPQQPGSIEEPMTPGAARSVPASPAVRSRRGCGPRAVTAPPPTRPTRCRRAGRRSRAEEQSASAGSRWRAARHRRPREGAAAVRPQLAHRFVSP